MRRADYERKADEAVQDFISSGVSLEESLVKIARRDSLNPEQIKRLVEMANTGTFLELFNKTAGKDDRMVEFEVADPQAVVGRFYKESPRELEKAAAASGPVPDFHYQAVPKNENTRHEETCEKVASDPLPGSSQNNKITWQIALERSRKVASSLEDRICSAEIVAGDLANKIASCFRGIYSRENYPEFEKNALALYGADAVVALSAVRRRLGLPSIERTPDPETVKKASLYYVVEKDSDGMGEVGEYLKCAHTVIECTQALEALSSKINKLQWGKYSG